MPPDDLDPAALADLTDDRRLVGVLVAGDVGAGLEVSGLSLLRSELRGVRLPGATLDGLSAEDVVWRDCDLAGVTLGRAVLRGCRFERCRMSGLVAAELVASGVTLVECQADDAWLRMARLDHCELAGCNLTASDWYDARISDSRIVRCRLDGSELSSARFTRVALHGTSVAGIKGANLRGTVIAPDQMLDVALAIFPTLGIEIREDEDEEEEDDRP
jgi:uncharacterized protein YjbI with pentapeptide repeats